MGKIEELKRAVSQLRAEKLAAFRTWSNEFDAARFDEKIERDAEGGKLDRLAD